MGRKLSSAGQEWGMFTISSQCCGRETGYSACHIRYLPEVCPSKSLPILNYKYLQHSRASWWTISQFSLGLFRLLSNFKPMNICFGIQLYEKTIGCPTSDILIFTQPFTFCLPVLYLMFNCLQQLSPSHANAKLCVLLCTPPL